MPLITRPDFDELKSNAEARIRARLPDATFRRRSVLAALRDAIAANTGMSLAFTEQAAKLAHPATSEGDELTALAQVWSVERKAATAAVIKFRVTNYTGSGDNFAQGSTCTVDGREYVVTVGAQIGANGNGDYDYTAEASEAGIVETANVGDSVSTGIQGDNDGISITSFANGSNNETDDELRQRMINIIRAPISGGTLADWKRWTEALPGVTRAFIGGGDGYVSIAALYDGRADPTPTQGDLDAIKAALLPNRPAGITLTFSAPTAQVVDITLANFKLPPEFTNAETAKAAIRAGIQNIINERAFVSGFGRSTLPKSWVSEGALSAIPAAEFNISIPADDVEITGGKYPRAGTITFA